MSLTDAINEQIKTAMKAGDKVRLETLRSIRAGILEFEKSGIDRAMTDDDAFKIVNSAAKKRKDAIEQFESAGDAVLLGVDTFWQGVDVPVRRCPAWCSSSSPSPTSPRPSRSRASAGSRRTAGSISGTGPCPRPS